MKKILAFSFFPAFVPPSSGGESRLFNFYKSLSKFHHVILLTSTHLNGKEEKIYHGSNFVERRIPKDLHYVEKSNELSPYASGGDLSAVCITACGRHSTLLHSAFLEEYPEADMIIHDSPFTVDYDLFFGVDDKIRIYNSYNCETVLYKALHPDSRSQPIWNLIKSAEVRMLEGCDAVLYCNKDDLHEFKQLVPKSKYTAIFAPNGMLPLAKSVRKLAAQKVSSCIFIGSAHPPNIEAAWQITNHIAPALPSITFHILGTCLAKGKYPENVVRHGFVDDHVKEELINQADLAINPMGIGSGSNIKVFDLFSYGVPVLSSEFGMRGINAEYGVECLIAPVTDFSKAITLWSERYEELQRIGKKGQQFVLKNYSWDVIAQNVSKKLKGVKKNTGWNEKFTLVLNDYDSFKSSGGGGVRTKGIYRAVNEWCPVVFICFSDNDELTVRYENDRTIVFSIPKTKEHIEAMQAVNFHFHVSASDIIAHRYCQSNPLLVAVYHVLKNLCRNIVIEHPYMASIPIYFNDRFIYSSHNHETQLKKDLLLHHPLYQELMSDVENIEREAVICSSAVIAVSQEDVDALIRNTSTSGPAIVVPNGASNPIAPNEHELESVRKPICKGRSAVFVGSSHMPNIDALKYLVDKLAPSCPDVDFHIIGSVCTTFPDKETDNIHFWGILSETMKSAVMQSCSLALNPVISGGGSNIKLADYFANGLYVVTTPFGLRGYPEEIQPYLVVAQQHHFADAIKDSFLALKNEQAKARSIRRQFFAHHLSMTAKAQDIVSLLKSLEKPKKKVLFVTYRFTYPSLGGAESMLENLIAAMDSTDCFQIDVIAPEVSKINNSNRFSEVYEFDRKIAVKTGMKNVRFARFPLDKAINTIEQVTVAWQAQALFEKDVYLQLKSHYDTSGLAWGWGEAENGSDSSRWGFTSCGLHLHKKTKVCIKCFSPKPMVIWVKNQLGYLIQMQKVNGSFSLDFSASAGTIEMTTSTTLVSEGDVRPLAFHVTELLFDGKVFDLGKPYLASTVIINDQKRFQVLDKACQHVREPLSIKLTSMRGPFSSELESYLEANIHQYDLVITHNNIFRPAVIAVEKANKHGVPIISIPHAHLDDDFYHFPDVQQSIINSDMVLAAPKIACDFYAKKKAKVAYLPAGINTKEVFSHADIIAFENICLIDPPFVLVLGRKSSAKGYQKVINAVEQLSKETDIHVVMIGPDDDNVVLDAASVTYLGRQSRAVVRGALMSCTALVNMSSSESFGIVLLEAWMAGKPVIVNKACAAFHDLAVDKHNALMVVDAQSLQDAIRRVLKEPDLCEQLSKNGREILKDYEWSHIGALFVSASHELIKRSRSVKKETLLLNEV